MISRRKFLRAAGVAGLSGILSACLPDLPLPVSGSTEKVQLVYQDWRTDWFPPMAQEMLAKFHAAHPNIQVFYTPDPDNLEERMLVDMAAGTAPDVMAGCCDFFPVWAQKGYLLDLSPYVKADLNAETIREWDPAQYKAFFTSDGKQFGVPKYHGALALYYNKDLFDEYHIEYPDRSWTHDDYRTACKILTHDRDRNGVPDLWGSMIDISWERIQVHVNAWGGFFVDPQDPTRSLMAEPPAMEAMEWIRARMWEDLSMATNLDVNKLETRQAFIQQKLVMVEDGSWALKDILANADFRVGVAPMPAGPARKATLATTDGFAIFAGTRYPDAAWELLKFLIGKEYGLAMAKANFLQPARASLIEQWNRAIREEFPSKTKDLDLSAFSAGHLQNYSVTAEVFSNMADASRLAHEAWEQIFSLGKRPVSDMIEVSRQIQALQKSRSQERQVHFV